MAPMNSRRDLLIGGACLLGAAAAYGLKPRRQVSLMSPGKKLNVILPASFDDWISRDVSDLVVPDTPDSLAARLYGETVGRIYTKQSSGAEVIMLMAHGNIESNELQLHRPEVCYVAFGFSVTESMPVSLQLARNVSIPGRRLVARSSERQETIVYWTRLGEFFPTSVTEQRLTRLKTALHHYIPDGLLARFSVVGRDVASSIETMGEFIPQLVAHVAAGQRRALVGTDRAALLSAVR